MKSRILPVLTAIALLGASLPANAAPVTRPGGGACDSTGTATRTGTDQDGNKLSCTWDSCTYSECGTAGGTINSCVKKTSYSNPRDCKAVTRGGASGAQININGGAMQMSPK